jgi:hypothetical protein
MNKHQLERVVIKWLDKHFGNLTPKTSSEFPNLVFYVNSDNEAMMEYDNKTERVYINYDHIWSKIESLFHLNRDDVQSIMKTWLGDTYKLGVVTPVRIVKGKIILLEGTYKLEGVTPTISQFKLSLRWKRLTNWFN